MECLLGSKSRETYRGNPTQHKHTLNRFVEDTKLGISINLGIPKLSSRDFFFGQFQCPPVNVHTWIWYLSSSVGQMSEIFPQRHLAFCINTPPEWQVCQKQHWHMPNEQQQGAWHAKRNTEKSQTGRHVCFDWSTVIYTNSLHAICALWRKLQSQFVVELHIFLSTSQTQAPEKAKCS